ncbi:hypothetical protein B0H14DRAFT_2580125 [Mycena olivaceomarginata]|nr:hypothetical protein B0H14DRAFT_2580125 [Mycena olivaceomarginata]
MLRPRFAEDTSKGQTVFPKMHSAHQSSRPETSSTPGSSARPPEVTLFNVLKRRSCSAAVWTWFTRKNCSVNTGYISQAEHAMPSSIVRTETPAKERDRVKENPPSYDVSLQQLCASHIPYKLEANEKELRVKEYKERSDCNLS